MVRENAFPPKKNPPGNVCMKGLKFLAKWTIFLRHPVLWRRPIINYYSSNRLTYRYKVTVIMKATVQSLSYYYNCIPSFLALQLPRSSSIYFDWSQQHQDLTPAGVWMASSRGTNAIKYRFFSPVMFYGVEYTAVNILLDIEMTSPENNFVFPSSSRVNRWIMTSFCSISIS